jgi:hypothetical protein
MEQYLPFELNFFENPEHFTTQYKKFYQSLSSLARLLNQYLARVQAEDAEFEKQEEEICYETFLSDKREKDFLSKLQGIWMEMYVANMEIMREIKHYAVKKIHADAEKKEEVKQFRSSLGMDVFIELSRLHGLLYRNILLQELENLTCYDMESLSTENYMSLQSLKKTKHPCWVRIVDTFESDPTEEDEEVQTMRLKLKGLWEKPILELCQSDIMLLVLFLTQLLDEIVTTSNMIDEFRRIFDVVWIRIAVLLQEVHDGKVLDHEEMRMPLQNMPGYFTFNRNFLAFCSFYMGEIMRRFFHYDILSKNKLPLPDCTPALAAAAGVWIAKVVDSLAEEAFEDMYNRTTPDAYAFVGDESYFKYMYVARTFTRGAAVTTIRPHLHKRFFSESQVNKRSVLNQINNNYISRLFAFTAIDEYIRLYLTQVHWQSAVVVSNDSIEACALKQEMNLIPLIIQVISSFWVYDNGKVYVTDNFYECVGIWFWVLSKNYNSMLYDANMIEFVREIVPKENNGNNSAAAATMASVVNGFVSFDI